MILAAALTAAAAGANSTETKDTLILVVGTPALTMAGFGVRALARAFRELHQVNILLAGRKPTKFEPHPPPGMITTVDDHGRSLKVLLAASKAYLTDNKTVNGSLTQDAIRQIDDETARINNGNGEHH